MATIDTLLVQIDASTEALRRELARGSDSVQSFSNNTDRHLSVLGDRFTQVQRKIRSAFELFGVSFGVKALEGWVASAIKIDNLTDMQAEKLRGAREAMDGLRTATDQLAISFATKLAPSIETAAKFWREFLFPTGQETADKRIGQINERLLTLKESLNKLSSGGDRLNIFGFSVPMTNEGARADRLKALIADLENERQALISVSNATEDLTKGQEKWLQQLDKLQEIHPFAKIPGMRDMPGGFGFRASAEDLKNATAMSAQFRTEVQKNIDTWHEAQALFAKGLISPETMQNVIDSLLKPMDEFPASLKQFKEGMSDAEKSAKQFADTFVASFESRGIQALLDGDLHGALRGLIKDFADLFLRLTVLRPLAESLAGFFGGFGGVFGGSGAEVGSAIGQAGSLVARAGGGPVMAGRPYLVGEDGPELFLPGASGSISPHGGSVMQVFHVQAGLPAQWSAQLALAAQAAAKAAYDAVTAQLGGRR